eukprot:gene7460-8729_t
MASTLKALMSAADPPIPFPTYALPRATLVSSCAINKQTPDRDTYPMPEMRATKENFHKTIADTKAFANFKSYMELHRSMENLTFFLEIERYRSIESPEELVYAAGDLWRRFFQEDGGPSQLNIESALKRRVDELRKCPTKDLFDEAQNQVLEDMVCDSFRHFLSSRFNEDRRPMASKSTSALTSSVSSVTLLEHSTSLSSSDGNPPAASVSTSGNGTPPASIITSPSSPNQLSISISSSENPEVSQITTIDVSEIEIILEEVMKNNISIHNEIQYTEVSIGQWIASGSSGRVYWGCWKGKEVAVKIFGHEVNVYFDHAEYRREVALMTLLKHDNLVQCYGSGSYGTNFFHLTEHCSRGSLTEYLKNTNNFIDLRTKLSFALDIAYDR